MGASKSIAVQIAPQDLDLLKKRDLILFVGRPVHRHGTAPHVWRTFNDLRSSHSFHWEMDYAPHVASPAEMGETPDGPVALWFGPQAEAGVAATSDAEVIVVDLSAVDTAVVTYADGRWTRVETE